MADLSQLALLKKSVKEWNEWRKTNHDTKVDLTRADLRRADLSEADLSEANLREARFSEAILRRANLSEAVLAGADLTYADLTKADLRGAKLGASAPLTGADLRGANLSGANLSETYLREADLSGTDISGTDFTHANFNLSKWWSKLPISSPKNTKPEPQQGRSSSTPDWLNLVQTVGTNLFVTAATLASIIQGLDVVERRWREHKAKRKPGTQTASPSSQKQPVSNKEIIEIRLLMDDGSHHTLKRWVSDPDTLRSYIDAFSDPASKIKPLQVIFVKSKGRALVVDVTEGGKDNRQLNVILDYLEADLK